MRLVAKHTFAAALFAAALVYRFEAESVAAAQQPAAPAAPAGAGGQAGPGPAGAGGGAGRGRGGPTPGSLLWTQHCSGCHGNDSAGGRAPSLFDQKWVDSTTDEKMVSAIKNGVPNTEMTGFGASLTDEQIF